MYHVPTEPFPRLVNIWPSLPDASEVSGFGNPFLLVNFQVPVYVRSQWTTFAWNVIEEMRKMTELGWTFELISSRS